MNRGYRQLPTQPIFNQPALNQPIQQPPPPLLMPDYEPQKDVIETYGGIIKDLTDTDKLLEDFELRLRGKKKDETGKIVKDESATAYIKTDQAARDFVNLIRGVVNRHTDFSYYSSNEAAEIIHGACTIIPEWLMYQRDNVPKDYRLKIGFEAMSFIKASCCKAEDGRMLKWSKGAISENSQFNPTKQENKGFMDYIFPFKKNKVS